MPLRDRDHHETSLLVQAIARAIPTSRHAEALFDTVAAVLGDHAHVEDRGLRSLYVRDRSRPEFLVPWPLLQLALGEHWPRPGTYEKTYRIVDADEGDLGLPLPGPESRVPPRMRGLKSGELAIGCGASLSFRFADGMQSESCNHGSERAGEERVLIDALHDTARTGGGIEALAERIAAFDVAGVGPGRVWIPPGCAISVQEVWRIGLVAMRRDLWGRRSTELPRWLVADGFMGSSIAVGDSADSALADWRRSIGERPPRAVPTRQEIDVVRVLEPWERSGTENLIHLTNEDPSRPPAPPPTAAEMPAALLSLQGARSRGVPPAFERAGFSRWQVLIGSCGHPSYGLMRDEAGGWILVGEDLLDVVAPEMIDEGIDALEAAPGAAATGGPPKEFENPETGEVIACHWRGRTCEWSNGHLRLCSAQDTCGYDPTVLDGDVERRRMIRLQYVV